MRRVRRRTTQMKIDDSSAQLQHMHDNFVWISLFDVEMVRHNARLLSVNYLVVAGCADNPNADPRALLYRALDDSLELQRQSQLRSMIVWNARGR